MTNENTNSSNDPIHSLVNGSLSERLMLLMNGRTVRQAANDWGIGASTLNAYLKKGSVPNLNISNQISNKEGVTLQWLATGEGSILPNQNYGYEKVKTKEDYQSLKGLNKFAEQQVKYKSALYDRIKNSINLSEFSREIIAETLSGFRSGPLSETDVDKVLSELKDDLGDEFALIPGYRIQVSAGNGAFNDDQVVPCRYLAFRRKWLSWRGFSEKDLVIVWAKGDSMEPTINNNDTLVVNMAQTRPIDGNLYVFRNDDTLFVKRYQELPSAWRLISDNKIYPPLDIPKQEQHQFEVVGQVVHIAKDVGD